MPLSIPSHSTIRARMIDEAVSLTGDASVRVPAHPLNILLTAITSPLADLYAQTNKVVADSFITTATGDALDRLGRVWGITRFEASKSSGNVTLTASPASNIPAGTLLSSASGIRYETSQSVAVDESLSAEIEINALLGGKAGNAPSGSELRLVNPLAGVNSLVIANTALHGGVDAENDSGYRARILSRVRAPARSGSEADYKLWALSSEQGVTRAWVIPQAEGTGTVKILLMLDDKDSTANADDLAAIKAYIDNVRPIGAKVLVASPNLKPVNITIANLFPADDADVQASIKENLQNLFLRVSEPGGTIHLSQISEAISSASGEISHTLTMPTSNQTSIAGELLTLGKVTFT